MLGGYSGHVKMPQSCVIQKVHFFLGKMQIPFETFLGMVRV